MKILIKEVLLAGEVREASRRMAVLLGLEGLGKISKVERSSKQQE